MQVQPSVPVALAFAASTRARAAVACGICSCSPPVVLVVVSSDRSSSSNVRRLVDLHSPPSSHFPTTHALFCLTYRRPRPSSGVYVMRRIADVAAEGVEKGEAGDANRRARALVGAFGGTRQMLSTNAHVPSLGSYRCGRDAAGAHVFVERRWMRSLP